MAIGRSREVPRNLSVLSVMIAGERYVVLGFDRWTEPATKAGKLTDAEQAVTELALGDLSNAEIARIRGTSSRTVANQLASAFKKLGIASRRELAAANARRR